ncbi:Putative aminopeptidase W07G4.4 [Eumeta japonica]|uniref:Aminopeptidase W07G4.4 n=1 Tax=Eumeta variegata TaxID=151549 RepID=A0A4C1SUX7_EUMVA|nr:Putative aminopeptidase W07G4.4 [Eumeta japonica]
MMLKGLYSVIFIVLIVLMAILIVFSLDTRSTTSEVNGVPVSTVASLDASGYDAVILVTYPADAAVQPVQALQEVLENALDLDSALRTSTAVLFTPRVAGGRLIISPTGPITPYDDVRSVYDAARRGMDRALSSGARSPILVVQSNPDFVDADLLTLLGALEVLYVPIEIREWFPERGPKLDRLGVYGESLNRPLDSLLRNALALEEARAVTRDIAAGDPEIMTAKAVADYVRQEFTNSQVTVEVVDDVETLKREYPLFWVVNRAADVVERHRGNIIFLEYNPPTGTPEETVILVGKGITYDSGGVSLKTTAGMLSMSRDKSGAAAVAGFIKACDTLRPQIKVIGVMCMARNSIGEEAYVPDELVVSRGGKTVRVANSDAEGRMAMGDLLYEMKERAANEVNPHIYTIATLTGHARTTAGTGYFIAMDNHKARETNHAYEFQESANSMGDMAEVSVIRREDLRDYRGRAEGDDIHQVNNRGSGERGHQIDVHCRGPGAFMLFVSDLHIADVPYTHLDVAPSTGQLPNRATGSPVLALAKHHNIMSATVALQLHSDRTYELGQTYTVRQIGMAGGGIASKLNGSSFTDVTSTQITAMLRYLRYGSVAVWRGRGRGSCYALTFASLEELSVCCRPLGSGNGISDEGRIGLMEERVGRWKESGPLKSSLSGRNITAEAVPSCLHFERQSDVRACVTRTLKMLSRMTYLGFGVLLVFVQALGVYSTEVNGVPVATVTNLASAAHDAVILVTYPQTEPVRPVPLLETILASALELDRALGGRAVGKGNNNNLSALTYVTSGVKPMERSSRFRFFQSPQVLFRSEVAGGRLIVSPTGSFSAYDDIRSVYDAARRGMNRALGTGARNPILVVQSHPDFEDADLLTLLGALEELYVPIEIREWFPERRVKLDGLGIYGDSLARPLDALVRTALALEEARAVTRDIGGGDPERMTAQLVATYVRQEFANSQVSVQVVDDVETLRREYPLFWAVNRAANEVERHKGNVIFLEYNPPTGTPEETVILVGKGITYDSGGISLKSVSGMLSMSRDKAGAASVAGFLKACDTLRPQIKVIGVMCMARNSIGHESYVPDELIISRSGQTVRVTNADAEGRMAMGDLLFEMKERAANEVRPHIYTIATLTGHAMTSAGMGYMIAMDNHVARASNHAYEFQRSANSVTDMTEVSIIRREDIRDYRGNAEGDDIHQTNNRGSGERGHQGPGAFMLMVSKLNEGDIPYTHLDVAPSIGWLPNRATASPLLALAKHHGLIRF